MLRHIVGICDLDADPEPTNSRARFEAIKSFTSLFGVSDCTGENLLHGFQTHVSFSLGTEKKERTARGLCFLGLMRVPGQIYLPWPKERSETCLDRVSTCVALPPE